MLERLLCMPLITIAFSESSPFSGREGRDHRQVTLIELKGRDGERETDARLVELHWGHRSGWGLF